MTAETFPTTSESFREDSCDSSAVKCCSSVELGKSSGAGDGEGAAGDSRDRHRVASTTSSILNAMSTN